MLEFFDDDTKTGIASIYDRHILFNSKLIKYFDSAYKVRIGIDKEENQVYVFMISKDYALSGEINETSLLPVSISKSYVRVASKSLINFISNSFGLKIEKGKSIQFKASYDEAKKAIVINMEDK